MVQNTGAGQNANQAAETADKMASANFNAAKSNSAALNALNQNINDRNAARRAGKVFGALGKGLGYAGDAADGYAFGRAVADGDVAGQISNGAKSINNAIGYIPGGQVISVPVDILSTIGELAIAAAVLGPAEAGERKSKKRSCGISLNAYANHIAENPETLNCPCD